MSRPRFPSYPKKPHSSGQTRIVLPLGNGRRRTVYLGVFGSPESWTEYRRFLSEWEAMQKQGAAPAWSSPVRTVADLVDRFWVGLEDDQKEGLLSKHEVRDFRASARPLITLYGLSPIEDFGPAKLEAVHLAMMTGSWASEEHKAKLPRGCRWKCCRRTANQRLGRLKRIFRWGARKELIPWEVYYKISAAEGERRRRQADPPDVQPVDPILVEKTVPFLGPVTKAMVQIQRMTGMRPGELCALTPGQIDQRSLDVDGQPIWVYKPEHHKTKHLNHVARIVLGPKAQELLRPFMNRPPDQPCFSPREEMEALTRARREQGTTVRPKGKLRGFVARSFKDHYTPMSYGKRIAQACIQAKIAKWHPHQLRHLAEFEIEHAFDLDSARAVLRHRDPRMTVRYGAHDLVKAAKVAARMG